MTANLTPDYFAAEKRFKEARTPSEKLTALKEMLSALPKHKGTEKMQADLKRRIKAATEEAQKKTRGARSNIPSVAPEGMGQLVLVGALSGLVFATIENALYLHVFVGDRTASLRAWRWGICTAVHVGCSSIAGLGLRRMWRAARASSSLAGMSLAAPCLIAAMIVHGAYNAAAIALERTGALSFAE